MPKIPPKSEFYKRMLEAKKLKKQRLEQEQLNAEFEAHPERYLPGVPPIIVKTDGELKMDAAFAQLKAKLNPPKPDPLAEAIKKMNEQANGY